MLNKNNNVIIMIEAVDSSKGAHTNTQTYADALRKESGCAPLPLVSEFVTWDEIKDRIVNTNNTKLKACYSDSHKHKIDVLLEENGELIGDVMYELKEQYQPIGLLNMHGIESLFDLYARYIQLEDLPINTDESEIPGNNSDMEDYY